MKKSLLLTTSILLVAAVAFAATLVFEDFSYPDGSLVGNGTWENHSGTPGDLLVANGEAVVSQATATSEDATLPFIATSTGSKLYARFDFSVDDVGLPITSTDNEYFAHFKDDGFGYKARMYIVAPSGGGDYTVGLSTTSGGFTTTWPTDLTYGNTYTVIALYDQGADIAQLWIDPTDESSDSIIGNDEGAPGTPMTGFALRQASSGDKETIRMDNLEVSETVNPVATEDETWGGMKSLYR